MAIKIKDVNRIYDPRVHEIIPPWEKPRVIAAGNNFIMGIKPDGSVSGWGYNYGSCITNIPSDKNIIQIACGNNNHVVALKSDGSLVSWGYDIGTVVVIDTPIYSGFVQVGAGYRFSAALDYRGKVMAWGTDANTVISSIPAENANFVQISCGHNNIAALKSDGSLISWGYTGYNLGVVPTGNDFIQVDCGTNFGVALRQDGSLASWGRNLNGSTADTPEGNDFVQVSCGYYHSTALKQDGSLVSWGQDDYGQVSDTPAGNDFVQVSCGTNFAVALREDGTIETWGTKDYDLTTGMTLASRTRYWSFYTPVYSFVDDDGVSKSWDEEYKRWQSHSAPSSLTVEDFEAYGMPNVFLDNIVQPKTISGPKIAFSRTLGDGKEYKAEIDLDKWNSFYINSSVKKDKLNLYDLKDWQQNYIRAPIISCGPKFAVAIKQDQSLIGWGYDYNGSIANIPAGNDFVQVSCGQYHSTALKSDGSLVSWGYDNNNVVSNTPAGNDFVQVSCGYNHSTALKSDGSLVSWGSNGYDVVSNTPAGNDFVQVSCGYYHSTALKQDGSLISWGYDNYNQVTDTPAGNDFTQVSCGTYHATALKSDGSLVSWGYDNYNQVTDTPTDDDFTQVSCGQYHCTALKQDGSLVSWGADNYSQVTDTPTDDDFVQVSCGTDYCTALKIDGSLVSWGYNDHGQVVNTPTNDFRQVSCGVYHCTGLSSDGRLISWGNNSNNVVSNTPAGNGFTQVSCGQYHCTALKQDGSLVSWGNNSNNVVSNTPESNGFTQVSCGVYHCTALKQDGSLVSWGTDNYSQVTDTPTDDDFVQVSCGTDYCTALKSDGSLVSWGSNGHDVVSNTPAGNDFVQVSCGYNHSTALKSDGSLVSWGYDSDNVVSNTPTGNDFVQVSCSRYHCTALKQDGSLVSWGANNYSQVTDTPTDDDFVQVSCGQYHCTALKQDGSLISWGYNNQNQVTNTPATCWIFPNECLVSYLIKANNQIYKNWDADTQAWELLTNGSNLIQESNLTDTIYKNNGMKSINRIDRDALCLLEGPVEILLYVEIIKSTDMQETCPAVYLYDVPPYFPLDLLDNTESIELITWAKDAQSEDSYRTGIDVPEYNPFNLLNSPVTVLIWTNIPNSGSPQEEDLEQTLNLELSIQQKTRYLFSKDNRITWQKFNHDIETWETVNLSDIHSKGMTKDEVDSITENQFSEWFERPYFDFAIGLTGYRAINDEDPDSIESIMYINFPENEAPLIKNPQLIPDSIHNEWVELTADIIDQEGSNYKYQVWINGEQDFPATPGEWSSWRASGTPIFRSYNHNWFELGSNTVQIKVRDELELERTWTGNVVLTNEDPLIVASFTEFSVQGTISDPDGDNVAYKLLINGKPISPKNENFTEFAPSPRAFKITWGNDDVIFGQQNTGVLKAIDTFGGEAAEAEFNFTGTYKGLLFVDKNEEYYSNHIGKILKHLDMGAITAGQVAPIAPVWIKNQMGENVSGIELVLEANTSKEVDIGISKQEAPFIAENPMIINQALAHGEKAPFYVRIDTSVKARSGLLQFFVKAKGKLT